MLDPDRDPSGYFIHHGFHGDEPLLIGEGSELPGGSGYPDAVDPVIDQVFD